MTFGDPPCQSDLCTTLVVLLADLNKDRIILRNMLVC
jgi:hypothetical protein